MPKNKDWLDKYDMPPGVAARVRTDLDNYAESYKKDVFEHIEEFEDKEKDHGK